MPNETTNIYFLQFMACHPDKFLGNDTAKQTNLNAVQMLNQMIDDVQAQEKEPTRKFVKSSYLIDFVVPAVGGGGSRKGTRKIVTTKKSVTISFGNTHLNNMQRAVKGIVKLLNLAGVDVNKDYRNIVKEYDNVDENNRVNDDRGDRARYSNFRDVHFAEAFVGTADWKRSKSGFSIDWEEEQRKYLKAVAAMNRDIATLGMTTNQEKREIVSGIISRISFKGNVSVIDQLATLRRLSLLLEDNFDTLRIEDVGAIYHRMVIVIIDYSQEMSSSASLKRRGESGYVFSWSNEETLSVTIPLHFKDWQLLNELKRGVDWDEGIFQLF